jgi:flagellar protein FliJ
MPPFRFRLQTLARLHEAARDERRAELADALRVDDALRGQLAELEADRLLARKIQTLGAGPVDVDRLLEAQRYEAAIVGEIRHVEDQRKRVAEEIERRRAALVEADRQVKVLEKLRESQQAEHAATELAAEMKMFDEVAGRRRPSFSSGTPDDAELEETPS